MTVVFIGSSLIFPARWDGLGTTAGLRRLPRLQRAVPSAALDERGADVDHTLGRAPMTDRLIDRTLRVFGEDLASERPVPGGGSAAAYAGALGAALCAMILRICAKKDTEAFAARIADLDNLRADFLRLVDDDSAAFARVSAAMK